MIKYKLSDRSTMRHIFYCVNILASLILGLAVYVCYRPDSYVSQVVYNIFGVSFDNIIPANVLPKWLLMFIRNYLGDISWAYALTFTVCYIWLTPSGRLLPAFGIIATFEVAIEVLQLIDVAPGTFDWLDVFLEICITAFIMLLIKIKLKEKQT